MLYRFHNLDGVHNLDNNRQDCLKTGCSGCLRSEGAGVEGVVSFSICAHAQQLPAFGEKPHDKGQNSLSYIHASITGQIMQLFK